MISTACTVRRDFSVAQLTLIRRTIARECNNTEFDEFMETALRCGLDPLRRQIAPLILQADNPSRRRLIPWATIDGLRVIAARQGDYRPMESAPIIDIDKSKIEPNTNPLGIVRAEVRAWKGRGDDWFPVAGEAWWDEYAPLREIQGEMMLDPTWRRLGRVLISKCAEAQALRRGWPDTLSGLYGEDELQSAKLSELASQRLKEHPDIGRNGTFAWFVFHVEDGPVAVPRCEIEDKVNAYVSSAQSADILLQFRDRNRFALKLYWEWEPTAALRSKQFVEARIADLAPQSTSSTRRLRRPRRAALKAAAS